MKQVRLQSNGGHPLERMVSSTEALMFGPNILAKFSWVMSMMPYGKQGRSLTNHSTYSLQMAVSGSAVAHAYSTKWHRWMGYPAATPSLRRLFQVKGGSTGGSTLGVRLKGTPFAQGLWHLVAAGGSLCPQGLGQLVGAEGSSCSWLMFKNTTRGTGES